MVAPGKVSPVLAAVRVRFGVGTGVLLQFRKSPLDPVGFGFCRRVRLGVLIGSTAEYVGRLER